MISACVGDGNVHGLPDLGGLLFCGGDDAARVGEIYGFYGCGHWFSFCGWMRLGMMAKEQTNSV